MPNASLNPTLQRRQFLSAAAATLAATGTIADRLFASDSGDSTRTPLGLDAHSMRGMKWKATQLIEFAAEQRLDAVLLNSLNYFESLEETHLLKLKESADRHDMRIYVGAGGICENGAKFSDKWGDAETMLATGIRVAATVGSHVVCNSLRDYMVWESEEGATFQWTAIGDGLMDVPAYVQRLSEANPGMPLFVESISNSNRPIPFLTEEHWKGYPNLKASNIVDFLALCRRGKAMEVNMPAAEMDQKEFDRQHQRSEFLKSIEYLRVNCGAGLKTEDAKVRSEAK